MIRLDHSLDYHLCVPFVCVVQLWSGPAIGGHSSLHRADIPESNHPGILWLFYIGASDVASNAGYKLS